MTNDDREYRTEVIRSAARRMVDTGDDFWLTLGRWLSADALVLEVSTKNAKVAAYEIAQAYLRNEDRLRGPS